MLLLSGQTQLWPIRAKAPHIHTDWNLVGDQKNNAFVVRSNTVVANQSKGPPYPHRLEPGGWSEKQCFCCQVKHRHGQLEQRPPHIHTDWNLVGDQKNNALLSERQMRTNAPNIHKDWNFGEWSEKRQCFVVRSKHSCGGLGQILPISTKTETWCMIRKTIALCCQVKTQLAANQSKGSPYPHRLEPGRQ